MRIHLVTLIYLPLLALSIGSAQAEQPKPNALTSQTTRSIKLDPPFSTEAERLETLRERIENIPLKLELPHKKTERECEDFLQNLIDNHSIIAIEPILKTESINDPALIKFGWHGATIEDSHAGTEAGGQLTRGLKIYALHNKESTKNTYVFYGEGFVPSGETKPSSNPEFGVEGTGARYEILDEKMRTETSINSPAAYNYALNKREDGISLIVEYNGAPYILTDWSEAHQYETSHLIYLIDPLKVSKDEENESTDAIQCIFS